MREVSERLEHLGMPYYLTGSEALARYGQPRQTMDIDIGGRSMASLVAISALAKVDLIIGRDDPWGRSAMGRQYLEDWARSLGVSGLLDSVRDAT